MNFLKRKDFFYSFLFKRAKLAKFIRYEAMWWRMKDEGWRMRGASISITEFTEMEWNHSVFEPTEEHSRCSGKPSIIWDSYGMTNDVYMNRVVIFLSQSSRRGSEMIVFLRALRNIGDCEVVKLWRREDVKLMSCEGLRGAGCENLKMSWRYGIRCKVVKS